MPVVAAVAAVVGTGIAIYGAVKSANDQSDLDQERASIAQQQAKELDAREQSNELIRDQQAYRQKLQFGAAYAASGKEGVGIGSQLQIQNQADLANMMSNRETKFQETMLLEQGGIDTSLASSTESAGTLNAVGAGLGGLSAAGKLYTAGGNNPGYSGPQGMGAYPAPSNPNLGVNTSMGTSGYNGGGT
jgi:hypothetical protein